MFLNFVVICILVGVVFFIILKNIFWYFFFLGFGGKVLGMNVRIWILYFVFGLSFLMVKMWIFVLVFFVLVVGLSFLCYFMWYIIFFCLVWRGGCYVNFIFFVCRKVLIVVGWMNLLIILFKLNVIY